MSQTKPEISMLSAAKYNADALTQDVCRHFDLLGIGQIDPAAKVVVKPNLIMRCTPDRTATTNPTVMEAVIRALQARGAVNIMIADSPGGPYTAPLLRAIYQQTGMSAVADRLGVVCNYGLSSREVRREENALCRAFDIISPIADADLVVNVCKVKTHCMMHFSCAVKNLFGYIPGLLKPQLHYRFTEQEQFAEMLVDLAQTMPPAITVVDGIDGMEGDGPTAGTARHLGLTAAARADGLYALDLVLSRVIGIEPASLPTVAAAIKRGLCPADPTEVSVLGEPELANRVVLFKLPAGKTLDFSGNIPAIFAPVVRWMRPMLATRPIVRTRDCIGCGKCAETCPANTIVLANKKARIEPDRCIRCFCCHELCPVKAIDVKSPRVFNWFSRFTAK